MRRRLLLPALLAATLVACGDDDGAGPAATATATPAPATAPSTPDPAAAPSGSSGSPYIGSLSVDPADGTLMIGTGLGLYRLRRGAKRAEKVVGQLETPQGAGPVSSNLELVHAGPGALLASGHPQQPVLPENLGLMRSEDHGDTWTSLSGLGEFDYHGLARSGDTIAAVPAGTVDLKISRDGGSSFAEAGVAPAQLEDLEIDPADPSRWAVVTLDGLATSRDGGNTWRPRDPVAGAQIAWAKPDALYRVDAGGASWLSKDGGETWEERGNAGGSPNALSAGPDGALYLSLPGAVIKRSTDGASSWEELTTLD